MNNFKFSILTKSGVAYEGNVNKVVVNTINGEITILKNHIPLITLVKKGRLIVYENDMKIEYRSYQGVLKIGKEQVVLMSDKIENLK